MPGWGTEHRNASADGRLSSRMRAGLGSIFPPLLPANGSARTVTLVVSLMNQYLDMPLSHTAQIDSVILRAGYGGVSQPRVLSPCSCPLVPLPSTPLRTGPGVLGCLWGHRLGTDSVSTIMSARQLKGLLVTRSTWELPGVLLCLITVHHCSSLSTLFKMQ